jgi:hypothetical protein
MRPCLTIRKRADGLYCLASPQKGDAQKGDGFIILEKRGQEKRGHKKKGKKGDGFIIL